MAVIYNFYTYYVRMYLILINVHIKQLAREAYYSSFV